MGDNIQVTSVELLPLEGKHYATEVHVEVRINGWPHNFRVDVCGYAPDASKREKDRGWEPDWGMDHTESETHLLLAHEICEALERLKGQDDE